MSFINDVVLFYTPSYYCISCMSILIKSDELNYLIYKYLQEAAMAHTAFTFFNEAALENTVTEFKFNTEAGQLINLLQKGLILTQIESHIVLDEHHECKIPFSLIRPHHCRIVEKVKELKERTESELKNQIEDSIKRTVDIIKAIPNPEPNKVDIESKQINLLEELYKLRFKCELQDISYCESTETLSVNEKEENKISFLKFSREDQIFEVDNILPTFFDSSFKQVVIHSHNSKYIIVVFPSNNLVLMETSSYRVIKMFQLLATGGKVRRIHWHPREEYLVALEFDNSMKIFNLQHLTVVMTLYGKLFEWKYADEFVYYNGVQIENKTISGNLLIKLKCEDPIDDLKLSKDKEFILTVSQQTNTVRMYTFLSEDPLFIFQEKQPIRSSMFAVSKNATYILILLENSLKIWDVELSQLKEEIVEEERFNTLAVINIADRAYTLLLADQTMMIYDISSNRKATRGLHRTDEEDPDQFDLKSLSEEEAVLTSTNSVYIINKRMIQALF